jgi:kumamolisin
MPAMALNKQLLPIEHGEPRRLQLPAKRSKAAVDLDQRVEVTIVVRSRGSENEWRELVATVTSGLPGQRRYLTRAQFLRKWGASHEDLEAIRKFATALRLKIVSVDAFRRCVVLSGTLRQFSRIFDVVLFAVKHPDGMFRSHRGTPRLPRSIHSLVECVIGLDNIPAVRPHAPAAIKKWSGMNRQALLETYAIPPDLQGKGQCVAIIEFGGGFEQTDLTAYFAQFGLAPPQVLTRSIGGVKNNPAPQSMIRTFLAKDKTGVNSTQVLWTIETMTDLEMVGTIAPKASILLVQAPNDDQGEYHAVTSVIADAENDPSALSCSWGGPEWHHTPSLMRTLDRWFQVAAVLGITVCCATGDQGQAVTLDEPEKLTAQFPASSPYALACGGTTLRPKARIEVAWNQWMGGVHMEGGGGFSDFFPVPTWQCAAKITAGDWIPTGFKSGKGRAIPDVAAKADMAQGYCIIIGGEGMPFGGTSAATPLWAAVVVLLNEGLQARVGSLHELLYDGSLSAGVRDIVAGNTGAFKACKGWDPCTGWGSPRAKALLLALRG